MPTYMSSQPVAGRAVLWTALYLAAALIGRATRPEDSPVALVWPAAGVAVLWILLTPARHRWLSGVLLVLSATGVNLATGAPAAAAVALGSANVVHGFVAVWILEKARLGGVRRGQAHLYEVRDLFRLAAASVGGAAASAPFGAVVWVLMGQAVPVWAAIGAWLLRYSAITVAIVAVPLAWRSHRLAVAKDRATRVEAILGIAVTALIYVAVFSDSPGNPHAFLVLPITVWIGVRLGPFVTAIHGLVATAVCVAATQASLGPFGGIADPLQRSVLVQAFIGVAGVVGLALSLAVEDRQRAVRSAAEDRRRLQVLLDSSLLGQALIRVDGAERGRITYANPALRDWSGQDGEPLGRSWLAFVAPQDQRAAEHALDSLETEGQWHGELRHCMGENLRSCEISLIHLPHDVGDGDGKHAYLQLLDVTNQREFAALLTHQAMHDGLTGLPNRTLLRDRLDHALASARRTGNGVALVFLDVDHFKTINDSLGHAAGDDVIIELAHRLQQTVRPGDTVARLGGDEFVVCCVNLTDASQITGIAARLMQAVSQPFDVHGHQVHISVSAGVATSDVDTDADADAASLLRESDMAMYEAKARGRGRVEFFQRELQARAQRQLQVSGEIRNALERNELVLHYQPLMSLETGDIVALEALVRWQHPERGLLMPGEWLDVAERGDLLVDVGAWVLEEAVHETAKLPGANGVRINVNICAAQLHRSATLVDMVQRVLHQSGLSPERLALEITETELLTVQDGLLRDLLTLQDMGVMLSVDDFGTGYSSLSRLTTLPVEELKIDRSFVLNMPHDPRSRAVVQGVLAMATAMGLNVVAEGVETSDIAIDLRDWGCPMAQGFLWSPAVPADDLPTLLASLDGLRATR
jgi:diguanylate cyclase (GGDEF)-like protein